MLCHILFIVLLNVIMQNVLLLNVVMLSVIGLFLLQTNLKRTDSVLLMFYQDDLFSICYKFKFTFFCISGKGKEENVSQDVKFTEAIFLVMCDPSMDEL